MSRSSLARAVCLVLCLVLTAGAQTRRRTGAPRPAPPAAPEAAVPFPEDLATIFPEGASVYVEVRDVGSLLEAGEVDARIHEALTAGFRKSEREKFPFTLAELRALAGAHFAFAFLEGRTRTASRAVAILRSPTAETTTLARTRVLPMLFPTGGANAKPVVMKQHGRDVVIPSAGGDFAYAVAENDIVLGSPNAVTEVLALASKKSERSLASVPAFVEARNKLVSRSHVFLYFDAKFVTRDILGLGWNADAETASAKNEFDDALGLNALSAFAFALGTTGGEGRLEGLVEIDRAKETLLSMIADPPPIRLRGAAVLPAETQLALAVGIEPARIFDFVDRRFNPAVRRLSGKSETEIDQLIKSTSTTIGMKLREEFLASLGDEFLVGVDFGSLLAPVASEAPPVEPNVLLVVETTNPDVARTGIVRLLADGAGELVERDDAGIVVAEAGGMACAVIDGLAVAGTAGAVAQSLAAYRSGRTLAAEQSFAAASAQLTGDVINFVYLSPRLDQALLKKVETEAAALPGEPVFTSAGYVPSASVLTTAKYEAGLYGKMSIPAEAVVAGLGLGAALALPSLFAAKAASNESAAVGNLRTIGSAEATYYSEHNRYATLSELVAAQMLDSSWVDGAVRDGYTFTQVRATKTAFEFKCQPLSPSEGKRSYNITSDYVIRYAQGATAPQGTKGRAVGT